LTGTIMFAQQCGGTVTSDPSNPSKFHLKHFLRLSKILDGTSKTFLLGEKHVRPEEFGQTEGGDISIYNDDLFDSLMRIAGWSDAGSFSADIPLAEGPHGDLNNNDRLMQFGGMHPSVCMFAFADGSVHPVSVTSDTDLLRRLASRADGEAIDGSF
jgi:prepilin-type processing-associated H-X9-DG protein